MHWKKNCCGFKKYVVHWQDLNKNCDGRPSKRSEKWQIQKIQSKWCEETITNTVRWVFRLYWQCVYMSMNGSEWACECVCYVYMDRYWWMCSICVVWSWYASVGFLLTVNTSFYTVFLVKCWCECGWIISLLWERLAVESVIYIFVVFHVMYELMRVFNMPKTSNWTLFGLKMVFQLIKCLKQLKWITIKNNNYCVV